VDRRVGCLSVKLSSRSLKIRKINQLLAVKWHHKQQVVFLEVLPHNKVRMDKEWASVMFHHLAQDKCNHLVQASAEV
jgi:hypothetical protein